MYEHAQALRDIGILLANLRYLEELTGESLEGEDAAMVTQIENQLYAAHSATARE